MTDAPEIIRNEAGEIAIRYLRTVQKNFEVGGTIYIFTVSGGDISLCWVREEHVPNILAVTAGCCGQRKTGVMRYANESDVRRWTNNGGR